MTIELYPITDALLVDRSLNFMHRTVVCNENLELEASDNEPRCESWPIDLCRIYRFDYEEGTYFRTDIYPSYMTDDALIELFLQDHNLALGIQVITAEGLYYIMSRPTSFL